MFVFWNRPLFSMATLSIFFRRNVCVFVSRKSLIFVVDKGVND